MPQPTVAGSSAHQTELLPTLQQLSFPALVRCCADLLTVLGYEDVRPVAPRGKKGKNRSGGFDLEGWVRVGTTRRPIIAQVKQMAPGERVNQRYLDEVRGAALRIGATEAWLFTPGMFSYVVQEQMERQQRAMASSTPPLVPVQCVDGEKLTGLLIHHGIGVVRAAGTERVDLACFAALSEQHSEVASGARRQSATRSAKGHKKHLLVRPSLRRATKEMNRQSRRGAQLSIHFWIPEPAGSKRAK